MKVSITPAFGSDLTVVLKDGTRISFDSVKEISVNPLFVFDRAAAGVVTMQATDDEGTKTHSTVNVSVSGTKGRIVSRPVGKGVIPKIEQKKPTTPIR